MSSNLLLATVASVTNVVIVACTLHAEVRRWFS